MKGNDSSKSTVQPIVTVIITAFDRRHYLQKAVNSVFAQTVAKSMYEIIVVKNFADPLIDGFLERNGVINIITNDTSVGGKLVLALAQARGKLVAFLEDDDLWFPDKLQAVIDAFYDNPDLVLFRNNMVTIDDNERVIRNTTIESQIKNAERFGLIQLTKQAKRSHLRKLGLVGGQFNTSCMAISKVSLAKRLKNLKPIQVSPDLFVFCAGLMDGKALFDPRKLTCYRVRVPGLTRSGYTHNDVLALSYDKNRLAQLMSDHKTILGMVRYNRALYAFVQAKLHELQIQNCLVSVPPQRLRMLFALVRYLPLLLSVPLGLALKKLALGGYYMISPWHAKEFFFRYSRGWIGRKGSAIEIS